MKIFKRSALALCALLCSIMSINATGWPNNYQGVMLQGFYWDSQSVTSWSKLEARVDELSPYFKLIWIPNSAKSEGMPSMGYHPIYWFTNHNSSFGTEAQLRSMIAAYKAKGTGFIADFVVNHRSGVSNWTNFPTENWNGQTWKIGLDGICRTDEVNNAGNPGGATGANDTGENWDGSRDLDHTNANVQNNVKNYAKCLLTDYGYVGLRYDYCKGFNGSYVKTYNQYAKPTYSVGEYWDGYDNIAAWIEATGGESAAFDFPFKYACNDAFTSGDYTKLVWMENGNTPKPAGMIHHWYQQLAVTFIDNHDTYKDSNNSFKGNVVAANAFMLMSPGTPCVFYPHWEAHKTEIAKLIAIRNAVGIANTSDVKVLTTNSSCYMAEITGSNGKAVVKIGPAMVSPSGYSDSDIKASGTDYCVWTKVNVTGGDVEVTLPEKLYVMGNLKNGSWKTNVGVQMTKSGSTYTAQNVELVADQGETKAFFTIVSALGTTGNTSEWDSKINMSDRYGATSKNQAISVGTPVAVQTFYAGNDASSANSWGITPGTYNISFNFQTMKLTVYAQGTTPTPDPDPTPDPQPTGHVVYFDNSKTNWSTVYCYAWDPKNASWPGVEMEKGNDNLWRYTANAAYANVIFSNGSGTQTNDLVWADNNKYVGTTQSAGKWNCSNSTFTGTFVPYGQPTPNPDPTPTPSTLYLIGAFNEWTLADANYAFTKSGNNYTLSLPSLNGQFKIAGSTWDFSFGGDTGGEDVPTVDAVVGANTVWAGSSVNLVANNLSNVTLTLAWDGTSESATLTIAASGSTPTPNPDPTPDPTTITIYWDNSVAKWATPYIHYWGASESSWPGVAMTKVSGNTWKYDVPAGTTGCLFNAGDGDNTKTGDMTAAANHIYNQSGDQGVYSGNTTPDPDPDPTPDPNPFTVYWDNSVAKWATPYIHYWGASESSWPGVAMTKVSGNTWKYDVPAGTTGCLFNAGDGDVTKTGDMTAAANHIYNQSGDQGVYSGNTTPDPNPTPSGLFLTGDFNDWTAGDANYAMTKSGNNYSITLPSLNGEFKVVGSTWDFSFGGDTGGEDVPSVNAVLGDNTVWAGSSVNLAVSNLTNVTITLVWDGVTENAVLTISTGTTPTPNPDPNPTPSGLFLTGDFNDWTAGDANYAMTKSGNNYSITLPSLNGEFKVCGSTWDLSFGGDTGGEDVPSVDAILGDNTVWKGSSVNLAVSNLTNVTITLVWDGVTDNAVLTISTGTTPTPNPDPNPTPSGLFLVGDFNDWTPGDSNYALVKSGNNYSITLPSLNGEFKVCGSTWDLSFGGDTGGEDVPSVDAIIGDNTVWAGSSVNLAVSNLTNVTITLVWDGVTDNAVLTISTGTTPTPNPDPNPTPSGLFLVGDFNDWTPGDSNYALVKSGNSYSITMPSLNGEFKVCGSTWDLSFGGDTGGEDVPSVDAILGDNTVWKGSSVNLAVSNLTNVTITLVWDGVTDNAVLTISTGTTPTPNPDPDPEMPDALYVIGNVNGHYYGDGWDPTYGAPMTKKGGSYVATVTIDGALGGSLGYFSFATVLATVPTDWDTVNSGDRYGAEQGDAAIVLGTPSNMVCYPVDISASASAAWAVAPGTYTITANFVDMTITLSAGIEGDVNGDNAINVSDVTAVVDAIINGGSGAADVNGDNAINVSDITFIVDLLLRAE